MCQALEECQLSVSASQNVCLPGHLEASVSGAFGREGAWGWGLPISLTSLRSPLCMSKPVVCIRWLPRDEEGGRL